MTTGTADPVDRFLAEIGAGLGHLLTVDGDRISRDTVFCGGRWPAELLAEMEAARGH